MSQDACGRSPPRHICTLIAVEKPPSSSAAVEQLPQPWSGTLVHNGAHLAPGYTCAASRRALLLAIAVLKATWEAWFLPRGKALVNRHTQALDCTCMTDASSSATAF